MSKEADLKQYKHSVTDLHMLQIPTWFQYSADSCCHGEEQFEP